MSHNDWIEELFDDDNEYDLLISSGYSYRFLLDNLKRITIVDSNHTHTDHINMHKYLSFIVDDVLSFGYNIEVDFSLSIDNHIMLFQAEKLYPFLRNPVEIRIDLSQEVETDRIVKFLDCLVAYEESKNIHIHYTDLSSRHILNNVTMVDEALSYNGELKNFFLNNLMSAGNRKISTFSFFNVDILDKGISGIKLHSPSSGLSIWIDLKNVAFIFEDIGQYSWHFSDDSDFDIQTIRQLFMLYLGKKMNKSIIDVRREIQLIEMECI